MMAIPDLVSALLYLPMVLCALYLWTLVFAGMRPSKKTTSPDAMNRIAIVIPAHNEESVIAYTVSSLKRMDYPSYLFTIFVVADFCTDATAQTARSEGAICYERQKGERGGKGTAIHWALEQIFSGSGDYDAVIVFDADTRVDDAFLRVINARLNEGAQVIQGKHVISNPHAGWFPALTWAMMAIDNRYSNQGRHNLGLSAKHMGDSICFKTAVLKSTGWGEGLTDDYELRLRLLLEGFKIEYEPEALGYGQAPLTWKEAQAQRLRWARGIQTTGNRYRRLLFTEAFRRRNWGLLDGALGITLPSYTTLAFFSAALLGLHLLFAAHFSSLLVYLWAGMLVLWFIYPLPGLWIEGAPAWAYLAILSGPIFMLWRTWINLRAKLAIKDTPWIRTPHRTEKLNNNAND